jgi:hypothetical protein
MVTSSAIGITQQRYMDWKMDQETAALAMTADETDDNDHAADELEAAPPKQAKPRRKKRTRRGRA